MAINIGKRRTPYKALSLQEFKNGEIHDWYRLTLGYADHLVSDLIDEFRLKPGHKVLDTFSGAGTTAVECKKRGIDCWAVDANPVGCFATKVKSTWSLDRKVLLKSVDSILVRARRWRKKTKRLTEDPTVLYILKAGMIDRRWISLRRLWDVIAIKWAIRRSRLTLGLKRALFLALMNELVHTASNVRFGPELYCGKKIRTRDIFIAFRRKVRSMAKDLMATKNVVPGKTFVRRGDSRAVDRSWLKTPRGGFDALITSPPYPTEHDYTRNTRLELAFLEDVTDLDSLRVIKKAMIRSHTKGIYIDDNDDSHVTKFTRLQRIIRRIEKKATGYTDGFARLYGKTTAEYFGGMRRHFSSIKKQLKPNAKCAYVVGDQSSYFQIRIPTAEILSEIAIEEGFRFVKIRTWRERWSTSTSKYIREHILYLRAPREKRSRVARRRR